MNHALGFPRNPPATRTELTRAAPTAGLAARHDHARLTAVVLAKTTCRADAPHPQPAR